jgi:acetyl-CoA acetyltransferase
MSWPTSLAGQFEQPYGPMGPPTLFTIPVLRYMKTYGLTHEQLATVSVVQREWAAKMRQTGFCGRSRPRVPATWITCLCKPPGAEA